VGDTEEQCLPTARIGIVVLGKGKIYLQKEPILVSTDDGSNSLTNNLDRIIRRKGYGVLSALVFYERFYD
jgi:hypothetical protein